MLSASFAICWDDHPGWIPQSSDKDTSSVWKREIDDSNRKRRNLREKEWDPSSPFITKGSGLVFC